MVVRLSLPLLPPLLVALLLLFQLTLVNAVATAVYGRLLIRRVVVGMKVWQRHGRNHNTDDKRARAFIHKPSQFLYLCLVMVSPFLGFQPLQQSISLPRNSPHSHKHTQ